MSRRILHIIDSLGRNGMTRQLLVLARGLLEQGLDVHVAALDGRGPLVAEFRAAGIPITELDRRWLHDPVAYLRLQRLASWLRPDLIHTWNFDASLYGRVVARTGGAPNLLVGKYRIEPWKGRAAWFVDRRLARHSRNLVANTPLIRDWCAAHGLQADQFSVIPFGVPPAPASDVSREELLRELRLPPDARLIGVVGRLVPEKRVKDLIWAADLLRVLHDNLRLVIIGDGPLRPQLEQYARLASDLDHIHFLGERSDVWRIMPHLDVLWNASENRSQSVAILEAMAAGVPVVANDTPFNRELVIEGETGYLIPPGTRAGRAARARHTDRIFTDATLAASLGKAACEPIAEQFRAHRMVFEHTKLYASYC